MDYVRLGATGLKVSRICLGCMTFGDPMRGQHPWTLPEDASRPIVARALDAGITFFDTANGYSAGTSEEILGRALRSVPRHDVVVATKVFGKVRPDPNGGGLSRKAVLSEIDASLTRLGMDHVDLYQIHRWDDETPIEETMEALHDVVKAGKARYIGASSMYAWQFAKAQQVAERHGWTKFVSMQNHLNLLYREEEREMLPLCADQGVGVIPWSPLARGRLARAWNVETERTRTDVFGTGLYQKVADADRLVVEALHRVAQARGVPAAQVAIAWVMGKAEVSAPILGASRTGHIDDAVAALAIVLTPEERATLEQSYVPHPVAGFG
jgi:aryl-alcohol dehydrogenase-like predicted oxidoreductase